MTQSPATEFEGLSTSLSGVPGIPIIFDAPQLSDPFVRYLIEIFATEGWNHAYLLPAAEFDPALLEQAPVVITYGSIARAAIYNSLFAYVRRGGSVVALRPDAAAAAQMGIDVLPQSAFHGYWQPHRALPDPLNVPLQFHGHVDEWRVESACHRLAYWGETRSQSKINTAAILKDVGLGRWSAFAFNPVESIAYMRQGSPVWANSEGDGILGIRSDDLFFRRDGRQWNDLTLDQIPQADVLQRFMMRIVERTARCPLPRAWYFPDRKRTVVSVIADTHESNGDDIGRQMEAVERLGGEMSVFLDREVAEKTEPAQVDAWRKKGHAIELQVNYAAYGDRRKPDPKTMLEAVKAEVAAFEKRFGQKPTGSRTQGATWVGWVMQAAIERAAGMELNASHGHRPWLGLPQFGGQTHGYLNGTAMPQRFVDEKGRIIDSYQVQAHMTDQVLHTWYRDSEDRVLRTDIHNLPANAEETVAIVLNALSPHKAMDRIRSLIETSFEHTFGYLMFQWDPATYASEQRSRIWLRELFTPYLADAGIPIWSTRRVMTFMKQRRKLTCDHLRWDGSTMHADYTVPDTGQGPISIALPTNGPFGPLMRIRVNNGEVTDWVAVQVQGRELTLVNLPVGKTRLSAKFQPSK